MNKDIMGVPIWQWGVVVLVATTLLGFGAVGQIPKDKVAVGEENLEETVMPKDGFTIPVVWGDLGKQLVEVGVIDAAKFESIYASQGGLSAPEKELLSGNTPGQLVMDQSNAHVLLNLLWAFGLANENPVLTEGPMSDPAYGGAGGFASTGGWTISKGDAMEYYSKYPLVVLSPEQQALVENVSKGIYRPCCGNSTYFPDCNHGMAMLGLLELMASQGANESEMYEAALQVNSYWFPDTYLTLASYFSNKGIPWDKVDPKLVLGSDYSSASGFNRVLTEIEPVSASGGGSCGVQ
ncbi:MAG: hypothetical protein A2119_02970 [Candidatus Colwellbacteria bacterium GWA2_46_10]|uniref:Uncharacterized protein n=1 Tax=Candidatus Colwellbacteria bacterium GWA2_46_10 TaxID=1797684 RepID=A0A1G1YWB0_9BACT|nr:MAG: hypothetical protein A2119_02970 [Candidatus Colwellbacteria bacterium GWA2_46_10]